MAQKSPPAGVHVTYSQQYRRCRKSGCAFCRDAGTGHGPYWFAYWREGGKLRSLYLGKRAPETEPVEQQTTSEDPVTSPLPVLRVHTLGGLALWRGNQPIPAQDLRRRKVVSLLTSLLSAPGFRLSREALYDLLWPDAEVEAAARNLHATLHLLRKALDLPDSTSSVVRLSGDIVVFEPGDSQTGAEHWLDSAAFLQAASTALAGQDREQCRAALALYSGEYLPEEPYADWVSARREELRNRHLELLLHLAGLSSVAGDQQEAEHCYRSLLAHDSCHEEAAAALMALFAAQGRRSDALKTYQALASALETELGLAPSDEVEVLRGRLLAQDVAPQAVDLPPRMSPPSSFEGNLPAPLTSFVGRDWDVQEIRSLLTSPPSADGTRLLTLAGMGGSGKTRLSLAVAGTLVDSFVDGIWLVELAALSATASVPQAVSRTLGVRETAGMSLIEALLAFLRPRRVLLVLDTCEHLPESCAALAGELLRGCPELRLLATSRVPLGVLGEHVWRVVPLAIPPVGALPDHHILERFESVRLFLDRARAGRPDFALNSENVSTVISICRRLDGLPLAIELAAARLATLPLERIAARLDDRFSLLTGGNRAALPRQRTLQATMDWSYELLSLQERLLLQRLSVFSGGLTLEAAEAVCADPPSVNSSTTAIETEHLSESLVSDLLSELVAHSLVQLTESAGRTRFSLLETVRQYAQALPHDHETALRQRHCAWFMAEAAHVRTRISGPERALCLSRMDEDLENIRLALQWSLEQEGDGTPALQFAESLLYFWLMRGQLSEGRRWIQAASERGTTAPASARARALNALASLANEQGDSAQALELYSQSLELFRAIGEDRGVASVLVNQGNVAKYQGMFALARERYEEGIRLLRILDDQVTLSIVLNNLGALHVDLGEPEQAMVLLEDSLTIKRALGNPQGIARPLGNLAEVARLRGELVRAQELYAEYQVLAQSQGDKAGIALAQYSLGLIAHAHGQFSSAATLFADSLQLEHEMENKRHIAHCLEALAALTIPLESLELGGMLFSAAATLRKSIGAPVPPVDRAEYENTVTILRKRLGKNAARVWAAGASQGLDEVVERALGFGRGASTTVHS